MKNHLISVIIFLYVFCFSNAFSQTKYNEYPDSLKLTVFIENFENNGKNWIIDNDWLKADFSNGIYKVTCKNFNNSNAISTKEIQFDNNQDFDIEADINVEKGNGALVLGMNDLFDHFRVEINDNGEMYLVKAINSKGDFKTYRSSKYPKFIKTTAFNKVTIRHVKKEYYLFLNHVFIKKLQYLKLLGNGYGISAGLNSKVAIGDLRVNYLNYKTSKSKIKRSGIPDLSVTNVKFEDSNKNNAIDENEEAFISFDILNNGKGNAEAIKAFIKASNLKTGINYPDSLIIGNINPGETTNVKFPIKGNKDIVNGLVSLKIGFTENLGFPPDTLELSLATRKTSLPLIRTVDYLFLTDNGMVRLGKPVILKALVQNVGMGDAENVAVEFGIPNANVISNSENKFIIGKLRGGDTALITFEFIANKLYRANTIPVTIHTSESTGKFAESILVETPINFKGGNSKIIAMGSNYDQNSDYQIRVASFKSNDANVTATGTAKIISIGDSVIKDELIKARQLETRFELPTQSVDVDKNIPQNNIENPHRYALVIGNEDYSTFQTGLNTEANVEYAVNDAKVFMEYITKTLGVPKNQVKLITNATYAQMSQGISWLANLAKLENGNAELIFYYSGHGLPDENTREAYFIPVDVTGNEVQQGIKLDAVVEKLTQNPSKRVTMFLDACFSGGSRNQGLIAMKGIKIKPKDAVVGGSLVIYTSSTGEESSGIFREQKHGYFTYYLLRKLQESQGVITYKYLAEYIIQSVMKETGIHGKIQTPKVYFSPSVEDKWENWMIK